jgi:hypothetical protein
MEITYAYFHFFKIRNVGRANVADKAKVILKILASLINTFSVVGIATGYGLNDREVGVRVTVGSSIFSSPRRPDWLWCPPNLYPMGTGLFFLGEKAAGARS